MSDCFNLEIRALRTAIATGKTTPESVLGLIYDRIAAEGLQPTWISLVPFDVNLQRLKYLQHKVNVEKLPLFGIPFAVKDNFDVAGMETTAGCPAFAYQATETAEAVQRLLHAGALLIGKTNMDQFATGLVGTRSPYGACESAVAAGVISGGSSSGSAVAVARGLVSFALGTDTAGSGRVPAAMNGIVGLKPTRGVVSAHGVVPACRTLDCVSVFALTCGDASEVLEAMRGLDEKDWMSRKPRPGEGAAPWAMSSFRFGIPDESSREFFGDDKAEAAFSRAVDGLTKLGGEAVAFDYAPLAAAAKLLYDGPWVAERTASVGEFAAGHGAEMDETVRGIVLGGERFSAVDAFRGQYRLGELRQVADALMNRLDFLLLPTTPTVFTVEEICQEPVQRNSQLGWYTNFVNLMDMAAVAVPSGLREDGKPSGVSLIGPAFSEDGLLRVADRLHRELCDPDKMGATGIRLEETEVIDPTAKLRGVMEMAVVGAHLNGQPLNWQLTERQARLVKTTKTSANYRLFALKGTVPAKPGLVFEPGFQGPGIEVEVWAMPEETVGSFLAGIPAPLGLGTLVLEDGSTVKGFICEPVGIADAEEITHLGGWRAFRAHAS